MKKQLEYLWQYTQKVAGEELAKPTRPDWPSSQKKKITETTEKIDKAVHSKEAVSKKVKQKLNYAKNRWTAALDKYEEQKNFSRKDISF